jgi:hypothetical protein
MAVSRAGARPTGRDVDRELARAQGARRVLPWAFASALGGGAIAWVAGGGPRGAAAITAVGLLFVLFVWTSAIARCPACGASLRRRGAPRPGLAAGRPEACPSCRTRFD